MALSFFATTTQFESVCCISFYVIRPYLDTPLWCKVLRHMPFPGKIFCCSFCELHLDLICEQNLDLAYDLQQHSIQF